MTTVYLATAWVQYEGDETFAVCSTHDLALREIARRCCEDHRVTCRHDAHYVEKWEVDGECVPVEVYRDAIEDASRENTP